jgi:hypothetical protein
MDFKTATDRVAGCISHADIAEAAGVSVQTIRQARLDASAPGNRPPPMRWKEVLIELALRRSKELAEFAQELSRS